MKRPPHGIAVPCKIVSVTDGDTLKVSVYDPASMREGILVISVRLIDCWAPEISRATDNVERRRGVEAKEYLLKLTGDPNENYSLFVPWEQQDAKGRVKRLNLGSLFSLGRVLGVVFKGDDDVGEMLVRRGLATKTKPNGGDE
jgi:endonuclease YncB( thermonuclease family)